MKKNKHEQWLHQAMLIWFGALIGLSFIATPAKFLVTELDIITAIKVGRMTFDVFMYFELLMIVVLLFIILLKKCRRFSVFYVFALVFIYAVQQIIVMPIVGANTDALFRGELTYNDGAHYAFIGLEVLKALALISFSLFNGYFYASERD